MCQEFEYGILVVDDVNTAYMIKEESIVPDPSYDDGDAETEGLELTTNIALKTAV